MKGGDTTYILYHKYLNSCICQENRIAFILQSESHSLKYNQMNRCCFGACLENISLHSAYSGLWFLLFSLLCSCSSKCWNLTWTFIVLSALEYTVKCHRQHPPGAELHPCLHHISKFQQKTLVPKWSNSWNSDVMKVDHAGETVSCWSPLTPSSPHSQSWAFHGFPEYPLPHHHLNWWQ